MQQVRHQSAGARNPGTKFPRRGGRAAWRDDASPLLPLTSCIAVTDAHLRRAIKPAEFENNVSSFTFRHERQLQTRPPVLTGFPRMCRTADGTASAGWSWRWTCRVSFSTHFYVDFLLMLKKKEAYTSRAQKIYTLVFIQNIQQSFPDMSCVCLHASRWIGNKQDKIQGSLHRH